jgi:hypothetical protein
MMVDLQRWRRDALPPAPPTHYEFKHLVRFSLLSPASPHFSRRTPTATFTRTEAATVSLIVALQQTARGVHRPNHAVPTTAIFTS